MQLKTPSQIFAPFLMSPSLVGCGLISIGGGKEKYHKFSGNQTINSLVKVQLKTPSFAPCPISPSVVGHGLIRSMGGGQRKIPLILW